MASVWLKKREMKSLFSLLPKVVDWNFLKKVVFEIKSVSKGLKHECL